MEIKHNKYTADIIISESEDSTILHGYNYNLNINLNCASLKCKSKLLSEYDKSIIYELIEEHFKDLIDDNKENC